MKGTSSALMRLSLLTSCLALVEAAVSGRLRSSRLSQEDIAAASSQSQREAAAVSASLRRLKRYAETSEMEASADPDPFEPAVLFKTKQLDVNVNRLQTEMATLKKEVGVINASLPTFEKSLARLLTAGARDRSFVNNNSMMLAKVKTQLTDGVVKTKLTPIKAKLQSLNTTLRALETKFGVKDADLSKGTPGQQVDGFNRTWIKNQTMLVGAFQNISALEGDLDLNATQLADQELRRRLDASVTPSKNLTEEVTAAMEKIKIKPPSFIQLALRPQSLRTLGLEE